MIRYIVFFFLYLENPWKKPAKTHTRLLRVRVLRGYKFSDPDPYPRDPYPWPWRVSKPVVFPTIPSRHCNNFDSRLVAFKSPCKILAKSVRYTRPWHSSVIVLGVSSTTRPLPPCASSTIVALSSFQPSPHTIPCFEKRLRKLWRVLELFHGVLRSFHRL